MIMRKEDVHKLTQSYAEHPMSATNSKKRSSVLFKHQGRDITK